MRPLLYIANEAAIANVTPMVTNFEVPLVGPPLCSVFATANMPPPVADKTGGPNVFSVVRDHSISDRCI